MRKLIQVLTCVCGSDDFYPTTGCVGTDYVCCKCDRSCPETEDNELGTILILGENKMEGHIIGMDYQDQTPLDKEFLPPREDIAKAILKFIGTRVDELCDDLDAQSEQMAEAKMDWVCSGGHDSDFCYSYSNRPWKLLDRMREISEDIDKGRAYRPYDTFDEPELIEIEEDDIPF